MVFQISDKETIAVLKQVNIYIFIFYIECETSADFYTGASEGCDATGVYPE